MPGITRNDVAALIEPQVSKEIIEGVIKESKALSMFRRLPNMPTNKQKIRVLDSLPTAYWVDNNTNNGRKGITRMAWDNKYITAAELAVIVPIKEELLDDADVNIWGEVKPRLVEAFHRKIDAAIFIGDDKPAEWRADLLTSIINAGATVTPQSGQTLYSSINDAMTKVEESGYNPNAILGGTDLKGKFRMMLDTAGQPIAGTEIGQLKRYYMDNGVWDKTLSQMIIGDFSQAVYAIRQDITYKVLTEAIIQDPSTGEIIYNLAQEDMVALRVVMRLGWEIPNPITALSPDESTRFPFASLNPGSTDPTTRTVTFTVNDSSEEPAAVEGAKIVCGSIAKKTNASGKAVFKLVDGKYDYRVSMDGHKEQNGTINVADAVNITIANF